MNAIPIPGCRHDILGHNLKAIGLLRVLATCAEAEHRDPEGEGWWDFDSACFRLRSATYKNREELAGFLAMHYSSSQVISAWNNDIGYKFHTAIRANYSWASASMAARSKC